MKIRLTLLVAALFGSVALGYNQQAPLLPDPQRTPGDVLTSDPSVICRPGYTKTVRNVPQQIKGAVYREYGIISRDPGEYEIDHLISLELGGSNSVRNLWPESYKTQPLNAHVKDEIENRLHDLACAGKITFPVAQQAIAHNWEAAYVQYIGPLPGGAQVQKHPNQPSIPVTHVPTLPKGAVPPEDKPALNLPILPGYQPVQPAPPAAATTPPGDQASTAVSDAVSAAANVGSPNPDGSCPPDAPVKVSRAGIYHLPGDPNYQPTRAVACYADAAAASAAGYRQAGHK